MHEEALLAGIRAEPEDDLVRLAYADWLDENDRPNEAELIRVQLELTAAGERERRLAHLPGGDPRIELLLRREGRLIHLARERSRDALAGLGCQVVHWRRGVAEEVMMPAAAFVASGPELVRRFPIVSLNLTGVGSHLRALLQCKALAGVTALRLNDGPIPADHFAAFADAGQLVGLRSLDLAHFELTKRAARTLAVAAPLANLRRIGLLECGIGPKQVGAIAGSSVFGRLEELEFRGESAVRPYEWLRPLVRADQPRLRKVTLAGVGLSWWEVRILNQASWLKGLRQLDLSGNPNDTYYAAQVLERLDLSHLLRLDLSRCGIGDDGARALARSATLSSLEELALVGGLADGDGDVGEGGVAALAGSVNFRRVRDLNLLYNPITDRGVAALVASPHLPRDAAVQLESRGLSAGTRDALRQRFRAVNFNP